MNRRYAIGLVFAAAFTLGGCAPKGTPIKGVVTLDGTAVEGANVTFVSSDGSQSFSGFTDANGGFTLDPGQNKGIPSGTYKVLVVKTPKADVGEVTPGSPDAIKMMQKEAGSATKMSKGGMPNPAMLGSKGGGVKSELPAVYASANTTPLTAKVPPDAQPVPIELKSKP
jgi:hypothetical protein